MLNALYRQIAQAEKAGLDENIINVLRESLKTHQRILAEALRDYSDADIRKFLSERGKDRRHPVEDEGADTFNEPAEESNENMNAGEDEPHISTDYSNW